MMYGMVYVMVSPAGITRLRTESWTEDAMLSSTPSTFTASWNQNFVK